MDAFSVRDEVSLEIAEAICNIPIPPDCHAYIDSLLEESVLIVIDPSGNEIINILIDGAANMPNVWKEFGEQEVKRFQIETLDEDDSIVFKRKLFEYLIMLILILIACGVAAFVWWVKVNLST